MCHKDIKKLSSKIKKSTILCREPASPALGKDLASYRQRIIGRKNESNSSPRAIVRGRRERIFFQKNKIKRLLYPHPATYGHPHPTRAHAPPPAPCTPPPPAPLHRLRRRRRLDLPPAAPAPGPAPRSPGPRVCSDPAQLLRTTSPNFALPAPGLGSWRR